MTPAILPFLSTLFGWIYTLAWSISFYPQPLLNWRRQSTSGTTIDFPAINVLGFFAYFVSNCSFYFSSQIRREYAVRNKGLTPTVQFNDVIFAAHAVLLSAFTASMYVRRLWGFDEGGKSGKSHRISKPVMGINVGSVLGVGTVALIVVMHPGDDIRTGWAWIDVVYAISYVKLVITTVKYIPQVLTNHRNKSTEGWSIYQILLDFLGGILSLAQLGIDSYLQNDWSGVTGNPVKFMLGNLALIFDTVFMVQHYYLYDGAEKSAEHDPLLERDREAGI